MGLAGGDRGSSTHRNFLRLPRSPTISWRGEHMGWEATETPTQARLCRPNLWGYGFKLDTWPAGSLSEELGACQEVSRGPASREERPRMSGDSQAEPDPTSEKAERHG